MIMDTPKIIAARNNVRAHIEGRRIKNKKSPELFEDKDLDAEFDYLLELMGHKNANA